MPLPTLRFPLVRDPQRVDERVAAWREETRAQTFAGSGTPESRDVSALLAAVFANSPYLAELLHARPEIVTAFHAKGPDAAVADIIEQAHADRSTDTAVLMERLRVLKQQAALLIALADISGRWSVDRVTAALSDFADACVQAAIACILRRGQERGVLKLPASETPEQDCGYAVLGLGKLGGRELNYSSDIDLFVFFDETRLPYTGKDTAQEWAVQATKDLVRILQDRTNAGYVFRTDLRLRPDPGSTSIAVSRAAAQVYYESHGQNWERAALIKARPIAGDTPLAADFLRDLQSFIWRKSLDFYAIQDIHSIKRQIYAHKGGGHVTVPGHNIKLGRGGIREIEFFVQVQQLIWGGRFPEARGGQTLTMLDVLTKLGFTKAAAWNDLTAAYRYLRTLEHRLQMIADQQTQTLPSDDEGLAHVAAFMGHTDVAVFTAEVEQVLRAVESHYAELFEDAPSLAVEGNLVFTGTEDDPDTIATLRRLGYRDAAMVAQTVRGWHHGRDRATRSDRARQLLTELMPTLLAAFAKTTHPDAALIRFDASLSALPAGVPLLSVFYANPGLLDLVAEIMGDAPRLAEHVTRDPSLLDYVLEPAFYQPLGDPAALGAELENALANAPSIEASLDACRRWAHEQQFHVGVHALRKMVDPLAAAAHLSAIAEATIGGLVPRVCEEFAHAYGRVPGEGLAVLAYGKLASRELTSTSDLDLVFIYDAPEDAYSTGGPKSFPAPAYYIRLVQRLVTAFTASSREGTLYSVDARLRPNGDKGPLACSVEAFAKYQTEDAWTWEHMALTRTRVVFGPTRLRNRIEGIVAATLAKKRDPGALVADMRARMRREQKDGGVWDLKRHSGGLIDAEFVLQYLLLKYPAARPADLRPPALIAALKTAGALTPEDATELEQAIALWSRLQFMVRLLTEGELPDDNTPLGLRQKLAATAHAPDFATLEAAMGAQATRLSALFERLVAAPGAAAAKTLGPDAALR